MSEAPEPYAEYLRIGHDRRADSVSEEGLVAAAEKPARRAESVAALERLVEIRATHYQCRDPWCAGPLDHLSARELALVDRAHIDGTKRRPPPLIDGEERARDS